MGGVVRPSRRQSEKPDFDLGNLKMINVSNKKSDRTSSSWERRRRFGPRGGIVGVRRGERCQQHSVREASYEFDDYGRGSAVRAVGPD